MNDARDSDQASLKGVGLKVMGVQGNRLLNISQENSQDFSFLSMEKFFSNDINTIMDVLSTRPSDFNYVWWAFSKFSVSDLFRLMRTMNYAPTMLNPLNWEYFSVTPYRLGSALSVKYKLRPSLYSHQRLSEKDGQNYQRRKEIPDNYLSYNMRKTLENDDIYFDFMIQIQMDACKQPIDDVTRTWNAKWIKLATVRIPKQDFTREDQKQFCEHVSFQPWNGIEEHKPVGYLNRIRKAAYLAGVTARNGKNLMSIYRVPENLTFSGKSEPDPYAGAGSPLEYEYDTYPEQFKLPKKIKNLPKSEEFDSATFRAIMGQYIYKTAQMFIKGIEATSQRFEVYQVQNIFFNVKSIFRNQTTTNKCFRVG